MQGLMGDQGGQFPMFTGQNDMAPDLTHGMSGLGQSYTPQSHPQMTLHLKKVDAAQQQPAPAATPSFGSMAASSPLANFNTDDIVKAYGQAGPSPWQSAIQALTAPLIQGLTHGLANRYGQGGFGQGMIEGGIQGYDESQKQLLGEQEKSQVFRQKILEHPEMAQAYAMAKREDPNREPRTSDLYRKLGELYQAKDIPGLAGVYVRQAGGDIATGLDKYYKDQIAIKSIPQYSSSTSITPSQEPTGIGGQLINAVGSAVGHPGIANTPERVTRTSSVHGKVGGSAPSSGGAKYSKGSVFGQ